MLGTIDSTCHMEVLDGIVLSTNEWSDKNISRFVDVHVQRMTITIEGTLPVDV